MANRREMGIEKFKTLPKRKRKKQVRLPITVM
jgi:hypothetical protein